MGLLATGTSCLALVWVIGRSRVPAPPARMRPFIGPFGCVSRAPTGALPARLTIEDQRRAPRCRLRRWARGRRRPTRCRGTRRADPDERRAGDELEIAPDELGILDDLCPPVDVCLQHQRLVP